MDVKLNRSMVFTETTVIAYIEAVIDNTVTYKNMHDTNNCVYEV